MGDEKIYYRTVIEIFTEEDPTKLSETELLATGFMSRDAAEEYWLEELPEYVQRYFERP